LTFKVNDGSPFYSIKKNNKIIVNESLLGLMLKNNLDFTNDLKIKSLSNKYHSSKWSPAFGEEENILNEYNQMKVVLSKDSLEMFLLFKIFNDGIAFKYEVPNQKNILNYDIIDEKTEFNLSSDDKAWWIPAFSYRRYEFLHAFSSIDSISKKYFSENVEDISYDSLGIDAAHTPFTLKKKNGFYVSIHEANLVNYSSMTLAPKGNGLLEAELYPWSDGTKVKLNSNISSPWRTIQIAENSSDLLLSNMILNLNEDPDQEKDFSWVKPGKYMGVWWEMIGTNESTWWPSENHGANNKKVTKYIDFASEHQFDGLLVEGWNQGWHPGWCCSGNGDPFSFTKTQKDFNLPYLSKYALNKGIRLVGHHETGGQIQNYENQLDDAFNLYKQHGIKFIKTGYVNDVSKNIKRIDENGETVLEWHHGQYMVNHMQRVIEKAAEYEISIIKHEPIKDTGLRRKYPNFISREGAKGQEFNGFSSNGVNHITILPFTRMLSGPMDYTPGIFKLNNFRYISPDNRVIDKNAIVPSTITKELALYVVLYSPMQMAADLPDHYLAHPKAFEFIKNVPVDWSERKVIDSEIGDHLIIARKDKYSENWYAGGITNENERTISFDFSFLDKNKNYKLNLFSDAADTHWRDNPMEYNTSNQEIDSDSKLEIRMAPGGGFAMEIILED
jgi:alpha-glucosidase